MNEQKAGVLSIHGKNYETVAYRVHKFRQERQDHCIHTEILVDDGTRVVMKSTIADADGRTIGTGHAEEIRGAGNINTTSALENCETSAIGRALASCGYVSSMEDFASADEMRAAAEREEAFKRQRAENMEQAIADCHETISVICEAFERDDYDTAGEAWAELSKEEKQALWMAPTKARELGFDAAFTTAQLKKLKSDEMGAAVRRYAGQDKAAA